MAMRAAAEPPRAIALAGPTAAGKTGAALAIAREHGVEIVSVDSALVYRGMDIGTAKPTTAERDMVPHHLIDIRDPEDAYSAAEFAADATRLVSEINSRGRWALLVGGTMLYFKVLFEGLDPMPPADPALRENLSNRAKLQGWPAMHAELAQVDGVTAARLAPGDSQRIQRALEVFHQSGVPLSEWHAADRTASPFSTTPMFSLEPQDRTWLHDRIAQRFDLMLAQGFVEEVRALRARPSLHAQLPSMRCVGYRQAWLLLDEIADPGPPAPLACEALVRQRLRERGIAATRQLAKRQLTWLRSMPQRTVVPCDASDSRQRLLAAVSGAIA